VGEGRVREVRLEIQLLNLEIIIVTIEKVLKAFENVIQMELVRVRWEEIQRFQIKSTSV